MYKEIWNPYVGEELQTRQELGNREDAHAVAIIKNTDKGETIIGHVPRELSRIFWYFLENDGEIFCIIVGNRRRSELAQGGLEVECTYKFVGKMKHIKKLPKLFDKKT